MTYEPVDACRSCDSPSLEPVLDLGEQPLANSFPLLDESAPEEKYPLAVVRCASCTLVQLAGTVDPKVMFDDYLYFSSFSMGMSASAAALAGRLTQQRALGADDLVVEVASNDGYLLKHYQAAGVPVLGVEPAANVAAAAVEAGIPTLVEYFGRESGRRLAARTPASVLHANNVLAHVPDVNDFVAGIAAALRPQGIAVIETPWLLDFIAACEFDTVYHEHVFYYSLTALQHLLGRHQLRIVDVERIPLHGGSLRVTTARDGVAETPAVNRFLELEERTGVQRDDYYADFASRVSALRQRTIQMVEELAGTGARIAAYGAAAKGTVLLNHFGIDSNLVEFVVDRNPHKHGRRIPGVGVPIRPTETLLEEQPDIVLMLAWNFADEILEQQQEFRNRGGRFLIPVPDPRLL